MFDEIVVKKTLPLPEEIKNIKIDWKTHRFQTKDLVNCMLDYEITEDGKLVEHVVEREYVPYTKEELKQRKKPSWDLWKQVIEKNKYDEEVNYHGTLTFYTYEEYDENTDFWVDFKAYFVYGKLDKIELSDFKKQTSHKITNKKIEEERKRKQSTPWNVFKKYASYVGWSFFWKKMSNGCSKLSAFFGSLQLFIIRTFL